MSDALSARLEKLEIQSAHQEQAIEDLNKTITAQWTEIAALKRLIGNLGEQVREIGDNSALAGALEPPPPHY